jgi:tetratricopeptide (TPR) repeat protein
MTWAAMFQGLRASLVVCGVIASLNCRSWAEEPTATQSRIPSPADLLMLKQRVQDAPQDAQAHYVYGHALRLTGRQEQAAVQYLEATSFDPSLFVAYHELSLSKARPEQLDEAIERLNALMGHQPKVLMLRVGLSELLEQRGKLYPAAKVLVDLVYEKAVPEKYLPKVEARIHYLLSKNKDAQTAEKIHSDDAESDAPLPLPESSLRRSLSATKLKDAKVMQNFGHANLLP